MRSDRRWNLIVVSRQEIEAGIIVQSAYVVISITDPGSHPAKIKKSAGLREALRLQFHDAIPLKGYFKLPPEVVLMTEDHARSIWDFIDQWKGAVETIVVHCEQGMSRSPAIAAAICQSVRRGQQAVLSRVLCTNRYVYDLLLGPMRGTR